MKKMFQKQNDVSLAQIGKELGWIRSYARRYRWAIGWYIFLGVLGTVISLGAGIVSKNIIDIVTGQQAGKAVQTAVFYVVMQLSVILIKALTSRISVKIQLRVNQELRADIFQKILSARWDALSRFHSGDLLNRSSRDTDTVASSIMSWVPTLIVNLLQFIGVFVILFLFDSTLAFLALASAPIMILLSGFLAKRLRRHNKQLRQIGSETTAFHTEAFRNIRFIKAFHATDIYCDKLSDIQQKHRETVLEHNKFSLFTSSFLSVMGMLIGGLCFLWSAYRLWGGHITFGEMTLFLQLSGSLSGAFGALVGLVPAAISAATAAGRIMELTELPEEDLSGQKAAQTLLDTGLPLSIRAKGLCFAYPNEKEIFRNAAFRVDPGELLAIIGPSGGGKTTLFRLLLGLLPLSGGKLTVTTEDGSQALAATPGTRCLFAYVPQDNTLFSGTVRENLLLINREATEEMLNTALQQACAYDFVRELPQGLDSRVGEGGEGLSKGQIQRIAIARALLSRAPILLLDEATSALDPRTEQTLLENIQKLQNRTCIVTTHRTSVLGACHRGYRIENLEITPADPE